MILDWNSSTYWKTFCYNYLLQSSRIKKFITWWKTFCYFYPTQCYLLCTYLVKGIVYWYTSNCHKLLGWLKGIMQPRVQNSFDQGTPRKRVVMSHKGVKLCSKKSSWAVKGLNYFLKNCSWAVQGSFSSWMKTYIPVYPKKVP